MYKTYILYILNGVLKAFTTNAQVEKKEKNNKKEKKRIGKKKGSRKACN